MFSSLSEVLSECMCQTGRIQIKPDMFSSLIQHFEADFKFLRKVKPQSPEFRNNPDSVRPQNILN